MLEQLGRLLAKYLQKELRDYKPISWTSEEGLRRTLQPGDVLLVDGSQRVSMAIKYLTQSTWSHSAMYVGNAVDASPDDPRCLIEADLTDGVRAVPLSRYTCLATRICRPHNLSDNDRQVVIDHMIQSLGQQYDLKNITDLLRYLIREPPVPSGWRRRMIELGSGDPTRAICSTLIAQAFQRVRYPILPMVEQQDSGGSSKGDMTEVLHIRHHSLFTPRDFDLSPYFEVIKPTLVHGFDYQSVTWADDLK